VIDVVADIDALARGVAVDRGALVIL